MRRGLVIALVGILLMALSVKKATLTAPAATGNQSYTGVGFQPKAIIFFWTGQTAEGIAANARVGIGWATGNLDADASSWVAMDNLSSTDTARRQSATSCIRGASAITSEDPLSAALVSFNADGFTLNWAATVSGTIIHYLALGGSDPTNAFADSFNSNTVTGNQAVTGVGFQPDVVLLLATSQVAPVGADVHAKFSLGCMQSTTKRWALALTADDAISMTAAMDAETLQRTDSCFLSLNSPALDSRADFVSMNADGFTINWIDAPATAIVIGYLALKGGQFDVGAVAACTTNNCNNDVTVGFTPTGLLLSTLNRIGGTTNVINAANYIGGGDGTSEGTAGAIQQDAVLNTRADSTTVTTKAIRTLAPADAATLDGEADHSLSAVTNGFRLTWTTQAPLVAIEVCYLAVGSSAGSSAGLQTLAMTGVGV